MRTSLGVPAQQAPIESLQTRIAVPAQQPSVEVKGLRAKSLSTPARMETARVPVVAGHHAQPQGGGRLWIIGAVAVALLLALGAFMWMRPGSPPPPTPTSQP